MPGIPSLCCQLSRFADLGCEQTRDAHCINVPAKVVEVRWLFRSALEADSCVANQYFSKPTDCPGS